MNDEMRKLSANILSAVTNGDTSTPGADPVVSNFARAAYQDVLNRSGNGLGSMASATAAENEKAAEAARRAEIQAIQDKLNPANYRAAKDREDGGYSFYDPDGNQIGIEKRIFGLCVLLLRS